MKYKYITIMKDMDYTWNSYYTWKKQCYTYYTLQSMKDASIIRKQKQQHLQNQLWRSSRQLGAKDFFFILISCLLFLNHNDNSRDLIWLSIADPKIEAILQTEEMETNKEHVHVKDKQEQQNIKVNNPLEVSSWILFCHWALYKSISLVKN